LHTLDFYAAKTKEAIEMGSDLLYLKDAGGLLTVDTVRDVLKVMHDHGNGMDIEIHSHCTAGMADVVYAEALKQGYCTGFHVGIPPMAEGTAQPSVFNTAENVKALGYDVDLDLERAEYVSQRIYMMAKEEGLPTDFGPQRYRVSQYIHRIPGGVISNMVHQMKGLHIEDRVDEVIEECIRICAETGEPHMITPYSQFVCAQAAINVATGERYKMVIDSFISYALGAFGAESGYLQMDPNLRDRFSNLPRAKELKEITANVAKEQSRSVKDIRSEYGENLSDEELILRYMMKGNEGEIDAMRQATVDYPFHQYSSIDAPVTDLINELSKQSSITQFQVQFQDKSLSLQRKNA
jgi:oxaloacetate decarboxylase alpha subunit